MFLDEYMNSASFADCDCQNLCERSTYIAETSNAVFPSQHVLQDLYKKMGQGTDFATFKELIR